MKIKNVGRVDFMKKVSCVFLSIVMAFTAMFAFSIDAYASEKIIYSEPEGLAGNYKYEEHWFCLEHPRYVTIKFSSATPMKFYMVSSDTDDDGNTIDDEPLLLENTNSYTESFWLDEGEYDFYIERPSNYTDFDDDLVPYALSVIDNTVIPENLEPLEKTVKVGIYDKERLRYISYPYNSIADKEMWTSSNKKVATVSNGGYVVPKSLGTTKVTVKANGGATAKFNVIVNWNYIGIFSGSSRNAPTVNGKNVKWKISNKKIASIKGNKIYAKKAGNTTLKCKKGKITYTVKLHIVSYNTLLKKTKSKLKDSLKDPDSLKIYHVWKGYSSESDPTVVIDYGAKNSYGAMVRDDYCVGYSYYNAKKNKTLYSAYSSESKPKLKSMKKVF